MYIRNREKERLSTSMSLESFAKAMSQLDLSAIPPEKHRQAILDHLINIQIDTIHDRSRAQEIVLGRLIAQKGA